MTLDTQPTEPSMEDFNDDALATIAEDMAIEGKRLLRMAGQARQELTQRMGQRGATHLETDNWSGVLAPTGWRHEVSTAAMLPLMDLIPREVWDRTYVQAPTPEPRWDHRVLNDLIKLGGDVRAIIETARISTRGEPELKLKRKEGRADAD